MFFGYISILRSKWLWWEIRKFYQVLNEATYQRVTDSLPISLRADKIKLWLTPSAKQRRNPCSGLPAVYPDLSTRHDWPVLKRPLFCLS